MLYSAFLELQAASLSASGVDKQDLVFVMAHYGQHKADDQEKLQVWWELLDADGSGELEFDEFCEIHKTVRAPIERVPVDFTDMTPNCPKLHHFLFKGSLRDCSRNPQSYTGLCGDFCRFFGYEPFMDGVTIFSVVWGVGTSTTDVCETTATLGMEILITAIFIVDVVLRMLGESRVGSRVTIPTHALFETDLLAVPLFS